MITRMLFQPTEEKGWPQELAVTALRVFAGLAMAFGHGLGKFPPSEKFVGGVASLGFPMPEVFAWLAAGAELAGGILLAAGLLTRPASFFMAFTMAVAVFGRHAADDFSKKELGLLYLFIALSFVARGAGRLSLDYVLSRTFSRKSAPQPVPQAELVA